MAVLPMSRVSIYALKKDRKKILETVQNMGVLEVRTFKDDDAGFKNIDTSVSQARFAKARADAVAALEILERYKPEEKPLLGFLQGMKKMSLDEYDNLTEKREEILQKYGQMPGSDQILKGPLEMLIF